MKAVLRFDLSDPDDALEHKQALAGKDALLALFDMDNLLHSAAKYGGSKAADEWRDKLYIVLEERGINLGELLQ